MPTDIVVVRLVTGEYLIGTVVDAGGDSIDILDCCCIQVQGVTAAGTQVAFGPFPWFSAAKSPTSPVRDCRVKRAHLLLDPFEPEPSVLAGYLQAKTGLVIPPTNGVSLRGARA